ncbi:MAG TPA: glycosyltransferase family 4 protein [Candidatus Sulfomarinibacteraceae bacterium]|nr:glycosyltransferase family 4 protein [Candidatus Sulfomarinibacteraceae bacterium]
MQILFATPGFPPFNGGGERYARSLAQALVAQEHAVTVVTSQAVEEAQFWEGTGGEAGISREENGPLTVIRCPIAPFPGGRPGLLAWRKAMVLYAALPGAQARILRHMARRVPPLQHVDTALAHLSPLPDVVNGFNLSWEHAMVAAWRFARQNGISYVATPFAHFGESGRARVARNATMSHQRQLLQDAEAVLTLTPMENKGLHRWRIHPRRAVVIGGGVDEPPRVDDAPGVLHRHELQKPFVLFLGRVNYDKGAVHAAAAVTRLRLESAHQTLTLALAGHVMPEFKEYMAQLPPQAQEGLRLLGVVDENAKHALLQEASMLLLPSRADSLGIVLLEAWQHSTPVVGARAGGIPGVIDDEENGLLVPFGDEEALAAAVRRLLEDEPLRRRLGRCGQRKVRQSYTWEQVAGRALSAYRRAISDIAHQEGS